MQTATLDHPRAATLADLNPGDACFVIADLFQPAAPLAYLGTVTELLPAGGLRVRREPTSPAHDQGGAIAFDATGRALMTRGLSVAVELPAKCRGVGSLAGVRS